MDKHETKKEKNSLNTFTQSDCSNTQNIRPLTVTIKLVSVLIQIKNRLKNNESIKFDKLKTTLIDARAFFRIVLNSGFSQTEIEDLKDDANDLLNKIKNELVNKKDKRFISELIEDFKGVDQSFKDKKESKNKPNFEDFFINTTPEQIELLKELIRPLKGKELAMFISLAFNDFEILNLKQNSKDGFNQKSFVEMQNKINQSVNKFLDSYLVFTGNDKDLEALKKQLETILK